MLEKALRLLNNKFGLEPKLEDGRHMAGVVTQPKKKPLQRAAFGGVNSQISRRIYRRRPRPL